jgi:hypothetical protein
MAPLRNAKKSPRSLLSVMKKNSIGKKEKFNG